MSVSLNRFNKTPFVFFIAGLILLLACQTFTPTETPPPQECEIATEPTQDIDFSLDFGDDIFADSAWTRSYTVEAQRVSVSWLNQTESVVAYLDYLIFSCGHTTEELVSYFSGEFWRILFQNYQSFEPRRDCGNLETLALYEFDSVSDGLDYAVRYWVRPQTDTRVLTLFLVFPENSVEAMNQTAETMFPTLSACEG